MAEQDFTTDQRLKEIIQGVRAEVDGLLQLTRLRY